MDNINKAILLELQRNSRLSMRKLAALIHMTAPAVTERVRRLEEQGIITGYTIRIDQQKINPIIEAYVETFMKSSHHQEFLKFVQAQKEIRECHRISGNACYLLKIEVPDQGTLNTFLEALLTYANYRLNIVIASTVKDA
ncbi:Lrp/AsnC family transcriptional regulator [Ktedonosporobacter rubrisoli]|nr:Lrp/AsnC family transcriptional regulator [Ktedonosporobacter rubrisoli]